MNLYRSPGEQDIGFLSSSVDSGAQIPQLTAGPWSTNPVDKATGGEEMACSTTGVDIVGRDPGD